MNALKLLLVSLLFSTVAQGKWELITETSEKGVTQYGVETILTKWEYRDLFAFERERAMAQILSGATSVDVIDQIEVTNRDYEWKGETKCEPGDPKLFQTIRSYSACYKGANVCFITGIGMINWDPCDTGFGNKVPIPTRKEIGMLNLR